MRFSLATLTRRIRNPRRSIIPLRPISAPATFATNLYRAAYLPTVQAWESALPRILAAYERSLSELQTDSAADLAVEIEQAEREGLSVNLRGVLGRWADMVARWHTRRWRGAVLSATGVDLDTMIGIGDTRETLAALIERNVALVTNIPDQARQRIADSVFRGLTNRTPVDRIAKELREAVAMARRRARNVAADQLVKATSALNEERRRQAGISAWSWVHSGKRHPRPEHEARDGKLYSDDPADVGTEYQGRTVRRAPDDRPGQLPYCGCTSRAVLILE